VLLATSNVDDQQYAIKLIQCTSEEDLTKIKQEAKVGCCSSVARVARCPLRSGYMLRSRS
jgi:hypothetical protein